jgi:hypothetical protein
MTGISRLEGATFAVETLFLAVWELTDGRWTISAYASTPLPKR